MGLLGALLGNAEKIDSATLEAELGGILIETERIEHAYKLIRDLIVFTNKRLILIDKQGLTGKKRCYRTIPFKSIKYYSMESKGHFDMDAEIKLHLQGEESISLEFSKDKAIQEVYRVLSTYVLA